MFATDKEIKDNMRTRSSRCSASYGDELPLPPHELSRGVQVLTSGAVLGRLLQIYHARIEQVTVAVENSAYKIPAASLSRAILREHLGN